MSLTLSAYVRYYFFVLIAHHFLLTAMPFLNSGLSILRRFSKFTYFH